MPHAYHLDLIKNTLLTTESSSLTFIQVNRILYYTYRKGPIDNKREATATLLSEVKSNIWSEGKSAQKYLLKVKPQLSSQIVATTIFSKWSQR